MDDCLDVDSNPTSVVAARAFVRSRLKRCQELEVAVEDALLVATELVTNAVLHARTWIRLRLRVDKSTVRIEVHDANPRLPAEPPPEPEATSGRGLAIVAAVATGWGAEHQGDGKVVWAEIALRSRTPVHPQKFTAYQPAWAPKEV